MDSAGNNPIQVSEQELVITRVFDAPPHLVWRAWTEPELFKRWWGPKVFTCPVCEMDFSVGGKYHWCMRSPDGQDFWTAGVFREIVPQKKIVYTDSFADADGNVVSGSEYGMDGIPLETLVTVTFEDLGGKTRMTMQHLGLPKGEDQEMAGAGWNESFDKLVEVVSSM